MNTTTTMKTRTAPWAHQAEGFALITSQQPNPPKGFLLAWEMGTGKSWAVVTKVINDYGGVYHPILILCPLAAAPVWKYQFATHAAPGIPYDLYTMNTGTVARRADAARAALNLARCRNLPCILVMNYEAIIREPLAGFLKSVPWTLMVCDESHRIKAPGGKISRLVADIGKRARQRLALTGTPLAHSPLDIYAQYRFLDPRVFGTSFVRFRGRYAVMHQAVVSGRPVQWVKAFQNLNDLQARMYTIAHRVRQIDVHDLPPLVHSRLMVQLSPAAVRIYRQLEKDFIAEVDSGVITAANALTRLLRLQQLTGGTAVVTDDVDQTHATEVCTAKYQAMVEWMGDCEPTEKLVVFCRFTADLDRVARAAGEAGRPHYELSGRVKDLEGWKAGDRGAVLGVQIQAGAEGIDLTAARHVGFYSIGFSLGTFQQAVKRLHRYGQVGTVNAVHFQAEGTVDELILKAIEARREIADFVVDSIRADPSSGARLSSSQPAPLPPG